MRGRANRDPAAPRGDFHGSLWWVLACAFAVAIVAVGVFVRIVAHQNDVLFSALVLVAVSFALRNALKARRTSRK